MDETIENACLQNIAETIEITNVQFQAVENEPKTNSGNSCMPKMAVVKKVTSRLRKVTTQRKKYIRTKKGTFAPFSSFAEDCIQESIPQQSSTEDSYLFPIIEIIKKFNYNYEVMSESHKQDNYFLQDDYMNFFSKLYPEYLCIDFLCEIPQLELILCLFIGIDANGRCEIVSIGFLRSVDTGLPWLCDVFKKHNPNWCNLKFVICDKKGKSLDIIKTAFPDRHVLISFFHSLKSLQKDLESMDHIMSPEDQNEVINIFEQMVFAPDECSYVELLRQIKLMPPTFVTFFKKSWNQKKDSWSLGPINSKLFLKSFNTYLLSLRKKIRHFVNTQVTVLDVIEKLSAILGTMRKEKFENFASAFQTNLVHTEEPIYQRYSKFLTPFATELVFEQFKNAHTVKNVQKLSCGKYICQSDDIVTTNACSCIFFQLFSLPCCHIFEVRKQLSLPLFSDLQNSNSWLASNYQDCFINLQKIFVSKGNEMDPQHIKESERFEKCFKLSAEMWPLLVDCPESVSRERLMIFKSLLEVWRSGLKVTVETSSQDETTPISNISTSSDTNTIDAWKEMYGLSLRDMLDSDTDFSFAEIPINPEVSSDLT